MVISEMVITFRDGNFRATIQTQILHILSFTGQNCVCLRYQQTNALLCMTLSSFNCPFHISAQFTALGSMMMCM